MKTVKKMAAIILVGAMALSIAACKKSTKKVSADDFKKACENAGLTVEEGEDEEGLKESFKATNEDATIEVDYLVADSTDEAKEGFEYFTSSVESLKALGAEVSTSNTKIEASMEDIMYMYVVRVDDTIITVSGAGEDQVKTVKDIVKDLGI